MNTLDTAIQIKNRDVAFIKKVYTYYKLHGRHELAWRKKITPYRILVSEVMLQQTQVSRVTEKYALWMKKYPTLKTLSVASFRDVLTLWQGLGYQRRAKALYGLAKVTKKIPTSFEELCKLPGIGPYTASAICAFAYDAFAHPMLETNIRTALIEEFHQGETEIHDGVLYGDLTRLEGYTKVIRLGARTWYYALMDYGAHLKASRISHNIKSAHYTKQSVYKGSVRELRAKVLFAVTHKEPLPKDSEHLESVLTKLTHEGYIKKTKTGYTLIP